MTVHLTPQAERLLRDLLSRQPERRPEDIVEQGLCAIAQQSQRGLHTLTDEEFEAWLSDLAAYSDEIPPMPGQTFSRNMIYSDHEK